MPLVIEMYGTADKDAAHKTLLDASIFQNSLGCPDTEYETIKHLVGNKKETTWADVAEKALDAFTG